MPGNRVSPFSHCGHTSVTLVLYWPAFGPPLCCTLVTYPESPKLFTFTRMPGQMFGIHVICKLIWYWLAQFRMNSYSA